MNPGILYRAGSWWAWNDRLDDRELRRQVREFKRAGLGSFFIFAITGLLTPYLSREWMKKVRTVVEEAKKTKLFVWLYDEIKWPSGYGGGVIPRKGPEYRIKALVLKERNELDQYDEILQSEIVKGKEIFYCRRTAPLKNKWYFGTSYVDLMNPDVVQEFIDLVHEAYKREIGEQFGKIILGIFTDEPQLYGESGDGTYDVGTCPLLPWTSGFPTVFRKRNGYDIMDHLRSLFYNEDTRGKNYHKIRYDFWNTTTERFTKVFFKKLFQWCEENSLRLTGHLMLEDTLKCQMRAAGATMPHYEYIHYPMMDHIGRNIHDHLTAKQVSSVGHQLGKRRIVSEVFSGSGHGLSFKDRKWIGDWHYVLGINSFIYANAFYSLRAGGKRHFPPALSFQQPWWRYNRRIEDYFARLAYALTQGVSFADILLVHPIRSAWMLWKPERGPCLIPENVGNREVSRINKSFHQISLQLLRYHYHYDLGDESIIARHGSITSGTSPRLKVGQSEYSVVILPSLKTLDLSSVNLLSKFVELGGTVINIGDPPEFVNGDTEEIPRLLALNERMVHFRNFESALPCLDKVAKRPLRLLSPSTSQESGQEIWIHLRRNGSSLMAFMANADYNKGFDGLVVFDGQASIESWDPESGQIEEVETTLLDGNTAIEIHFPPVGSHLLGVNPTKNSTRSGKKRLKISRRESVIADLHGHWKVKRHNPNILRINRCRYGFNGQELSKEEKFTEEIRSLCLNYPVVSHLIESYRETSFQLKYKFAVHAIDLDKIGKLLLVVESPEEQVVLFNNHVLKYDGATWLDPKFGKFNVRHLVKKGENTVMLKGVMKGNVGVEEIYLIGDFAVKRQDSTNFLVSEEADSVDGQNLTLEGYPFFAGSLTLSKKFYLDIAVRDAYLELEEPQATMVVLVVNGAKIGELYWDSFSLGPVNLKKGENIVEITLVSSLRNMLGPFGKIQRQEKKQPTERSLVDQKKRKFSRAEYFQYYQLTTPRDFLIPPRTYYFYPFGVKGLKIKA